MACILIIDDDESVRTMLALMLAHLGHEVVQAADGAAGIRLFGTRAFDVVFTDMVMPGKDGLEVMAEIRRQAPRANIVAMSGGNVIAPDLYLRLARGLGAARVMPKPFSFDTLQTLLAELLLGCSGPRLVAREAPPEAG